MNKTKKYRSRILKQVNSRVANVDLLDYPLRWAAVVLIAMLAGCSPATTDSYKDRNHNGIRDDVENYIQSNFEAGPHRNAFEQYARVLQDVILISGTEEAERLNGELSRSIRCIYSVFEHGEKLKHPAAISQKIEDLTFDTNDRKKANSRFSRALNGQAWSLPKGDTCK